jgi:hypothetical protein
MPIIKMINNNPLNPRDNFCRSPSIRLPPFLQSLSAIQTLDFRRQTPEKHFVQAQVQIYNFSTSALRFILQSNV